MEYTVKILKRKESLFQYRMLVAEFQEHCYEYACSVTLINANFYLNIKELLSKSAT